MTDPRIAWFVIGATCSAVVFGWPWHSRFSRYNRMGPPRGNYGSPRQPRDSNQPPPGGKPAPSACPPVLSETRWFINNPAMYAECGGPCEAGPEYCDCGQVRLVVIPRDIRSISYPDPGPDRQPTNPFTGKPVKPQLPSPQIISGDTHD